MPEWDVNRFRPQSGRALKENSGVINIADYMQEMTNFFSQIQIAEKRAQLNLNSDLPLSNRRDVITVANNGTVTKQGPEYRIRATSDADSKATIRTTQRGNYESGFVFEPGSGFRTVGTPTGTAYFKSGYAYNGNAIDLLYDKDGYHIQVVNDGSVTTKSQEDWNLDTLDGSKDKNNPSGAMLSTERGVVIESPFVYYGYGPIVIKLKITDKYGIERIVRVHQFNEDNKPSINEPNLPIRHEVFSGDSGSQLDMFLGGRQISVWGMSDTIARTVGARRTVTGVGTTNWVPVISFRHKTGYKNIMVRLSGITLIPSDDIEFQIQRNATLNGTDFTAYENFDTDEMATAWDFSANTTFASGEAIYLGEASGGARGVSLREELPERPIYEEDTITLAVRSIGGASVSVKGTFKAEENW